MFSFFVEKIENGRVRFFEEDERHISRVLRLRDGEKIIVVNEGRRFIAEISGTFEARVLEEIESSETKTKITLYQGLPKGDKMDLIVQKACEIGVHEIVPVLFSRCISEKFKSERLNKIAREAAKQAKRSLIPEVLDLIGFEELKNRLARHELSLVAWEDEKTSRLREMIDGQRDIAIVIGPEGGLSNEEVEGLRAAGAKAVTLGSRILRTEPAPLVMTSAIFTLLGEL